MRDLEIYERRAREAEGLARFVALPQNRTRYLAIASAWRELIVRARAEADAEAPRAA